MRELHIETFNLDELAVEPALTGDSGLTVKMTGSATVVQPAELRAYLQRIHGECMRLAVREVTIDLGELEFMNSAGFSSLIDWLVALQAEEKAKQYSVRFLSNAEHHWQRRSLNALKCLAVDLVTIET